MIGEKESDNMKRMMMMMMSCNLLYNVAEVCSQDGIHIDQGMTDIWELTDIENKGT